MRCRFYILIITLLFPLVVFAQASGGQISRKPQTSSYTKSSKQNEKARIIQRIKDNMVYVEGGTYTMVATVEQGNKTEFSDVDNPVHEVSLSSFFISRYEVTQEEFLAVMGYNPSHFKGLKRPVECVSWTQCVDFIKQINRITGMSFRLPTEAEWEYAARGGTLSKQYRYSGSNDLNFIGWYENNSESSTHNVGQKEPNELGIYDMSGNVEEWCSDYCDRNGSFKQKDPNANEDGLYRIIRGGAWSMSANQCCVSYRSYDAPVNCYIRLGFRLVLSK